MPALRLYLCALLAMLSLCGYAAATEKTGYEETDRESGDCPGVELFWKVENDSEDSMLFFRMKDGQIVTVGVGQAMFSSDCNYFWLTEHEESRSISVFETATGKEIASFKGSYPAWAPDSKRIYMSKIKKKLSGFAGYKAAWPAHSTKFHMARMPQKYQLWSWSLPEREKTRILEVADFCMCYPPSHLSDGYPVEFDADGNIFWTYPTCGRTPQGSRTGKFLKIDPSSWEIKDIGSDEFICRDPIGD